MWRLHTQSKDASVSVWKAANAILTLFSNEVGHVTGTEPIVDAVCRF